MQALAIMSLPTISMQVTSPPQKQGETCSLQSGTNLEQKRSLPSHFLSVLARSQPTIHFLQGDNDQSLTFVLSPLSCRGSFSSLFSFRQIADSTLACSFLLEVCMYNGIAPKANFSEKGKAKSNGWVVGYEGISGSNGSACSSFGIWHRYSPCLEKVSLYLPFFFSSQGGDAERKKPSYTLPLLSVLQARNSCQFGQDSC